MSYEGRTLLDETVERTHLLRVWLAGQDGITSHDKRASLKPSPMTRNEIGGLVEWTRSTPLEFST